jgi:formamidase
MGVSGVAPSRAVGAWTRREADLLARGGMVPPDASGAVPPRAPRPFMDCGRCRHARQRGNFDVKQLSRGEAPPARGRRRRAFSTGDHFAKGDGEVCVTAVEMGATCGAFSRASGRGRATPHPVAEIQRSGYFIDPRWAVPQRFIATMGMPVDEQGVNKVRTLTRPAGASPQRSPCFRSAASREQAPRICSVAVDLRISNVVDVPRRGVRPAPGGHLQGDRRRLRQGRNAATLALRFQEPQQVGVDGIGPVVGMPCGKPL